MKQEALTEIENYENLIAEIDELYNNLATVHQQNMKCKKGCDQCCMDLFVFPVEFYATKAKIEKPGTNLPKETDTKNSACAFLVDHTCAIYEARPLICRTHGLPLLYMHKDDWHLNHCPLNFDMVDDDYFTYDNTYPQDKYNRKLFMINKEFIQHMDEEMDEKTRIPLKELLPDS